MISGAEPQPFIQRKHRAKLTHRPTDQALSGSSVTSLDITGEPSLDPLLHPQQLPVPFSNQSSVNGFHNDPQITIFSPDSLQSSRLHTRLSKLGRGWPPPTSICRFIPFPYRRSPTISVETLGSCHSLLFFFQNAHTSGLPNPKDAPLSGCILSRQSPGPSGSVLPVLQTPAFSPPRISSRGTQAFQATGTETANSDCTLPLAPTAPISKG